MNREEKSKASKEKIIQAAYSLFLSKGYDNTSTQDIIELSCLSRGAMYHHFKSKEDILSCVSEGFYVKMNNFLEDLVSNPYLSAKEKITKLITYSALDYKDRQMVHGYWNEKIPFALLKEVRHLNNVVSPNICKIITQGIENNEFACEYPLELSEIIVFVVDVILDPQLFSRSYLEICSRLDFLFFMLNKMDINLIDSEGLGKIKEMYKQGESDETDK